MASAKFSERVRKRVRDGKVVNARQAAAIDAARGRVMRRSQRVPRIEDMVNSEAIEAMEEQLSMPSHTVSKFEWVAAPKKPEIRKIRFKSKNCKRLQRRKCE